MYSLKNTVSNPLPRIMSLLQDDTNLTPMVGAEIEFYLTCSDKDSFLPAFYAACAKEHIAVSPIEKERGTEQYELQLPPLLDPVKLTEQLLSLRALLQDNARFDAKPFPDEPGSAIHYHISLHDSTSRNMLQKDGNQESIIMQYALGGLCHTLAESMVFFSPTKDSYRRFVPHMEAPTTICWGGNNRTTALRIPDGDPMHRRIEHRLPAADCDPSLALAAILAGIHVGITEKILPPERIYGNAHDRQYGLVRLPSSLEEARQAYEAGTVIKRVIY